MSVISLAILLKLIAYRFLITSSELLQNGLKPQIHLDRQGPFTTSVCDYAGNIAMIENNGVAPNRDCNPLCSDCIVFNESSIASVIIAALAMTLSVNGP